MKRVFSVLFSIFVFSFVLLAQQSDEASKMSVRSFTLAENDNTANLHGTTVLDQNGDPCALIRVQTTQTGFAWDFGQMAACKVEQKTGEIWLYVPYGVKRVTVRHAQLGTMTYEFPISIAKARTYVMDLVAANVVVLVEQEITQQWLVFRLNPSSALVELDGQMLEVRSGVAKKFVPFGKYKFNVSARNYLSASGEVEVNSADSSVVVDINLVPAFGTLNFTSSPELEGAVVFVDNEPVGLIPLDDPLELPSGSHNIKLNKPMYKAFNTDVSVIAGQSLELSPVLEPNFSEVSVTTMEGAEIWANGVLLGVSPWRGNLQYDTYSVEIRKASHRSVFRTIEFYEGASPEITLPSPMPIYGSLNIDSEQRASVKLDGEPVGEVPKFVPKVLVGEHKVELSAHGYQTISKVVTVQEGKTEIVNITLVKGRDVPVANTVPVAPVVAAAPEAPAAPSLDAAPAAPAKKKPKVYRNMLRFGYSPLKLYEKDSGDELNMHMVAAGLRHCFIKKHIGLSLGADFNYCFREDLRGVDYSDITISLPVDLVLRFGPLRFSGGVFAGYNMPKAIKLNETVDLTSIESTGGEVPPRIEKFVYGYQAAVLCDLGGGFSIGYTYAENKSPINASSHVDATGYRLNMIMHMANICIMF